MNARQLYLAWLRSTHPDIYVAALRKVAGKPRSLGGLGQDLMSSMTAPDMASIASDVQLLPDVTTALDSATTSSSGRWTDIFPSIANAVTSLANTYFTTSAQSNLLSAQSNLLQLNTQRATQGLPPVTAAGLPVTAAGLMPTSASLYALEQRLAGGTGGSMTWLLVGAAVVVGLMIFGRSRSRGK
ncbi:MAG: hypothetical protein ACRDUW_24375 [Pseudonocardiaceae bacterium]